jgi:hypothetical protein
MRSVRPRVNAQQEGGSIYFSIRTFLAIGIDALPAGPVPFLQDFGQRE